MTRLSANLRPSSSHSVISILNSFSFPNASHDHGNKRRRVLRKAYPVQCTSLPEQSSQARHQAGLSPDSTIPISPATLRPGRSCVQGRPSYRSTSSSSSSRAPERLSPLVRNVPQAEECFEVADESDIEFKAWKQIKRPKTPRKRSETIWSFDHDVAPDVVVCSPRQSYDGPKRKRSYAAASREQLLGVAKPCPELCDPLSQFDFGLSKSPSTIRENRPRPQPLWAEEGWERAQRAHTSHGTQEFGRPSSPYDRWQLSRPNTAVTTPLVHRNPSGSSHGSHDSGTTDTLQNQRRSSSSVTSSLRRRASNAASDVVVHSRTIMGRIKDSIGAVIAGRSAEDTSKQPKRFVVKNRARGRRWVVFDDGSDEEVCQDGVGQTSQLCLKQSRLSHEGTLEEHVENWHSWQVRGERRTLRIEIEESPRKSRIRKWITVSRGRRQKFAS
jgi:hypothetical protein